MKNTDTGTTWCNQKAGRDGRRSQHKAGGFGCLQVESLSWTWDKSLEAEDAQGFQLKADLSAMCTGELVS